MKIAYPSLLLIIILICGCKENKNPAASESQNNSTPLENKVAGKSNTWTQKEKEKWLKPCLLGLSALYGDEGARKTCDCMLTKMQEKHKAYRDVDNNDPQESTRLMQECNDLNVESLLKNELR